MARTFRRAWSADRNPFMKNQAARLIRRISVFEEVPDGKAYRRYFNPWNISDYCWEVKDPRFDPPHLPGYLDEAFEDRWFQKELRRYTIHTGNRRAHRPRPKRGFK